MLPNMYCDHAYKIREISDTRLKFGASKQVLDIHGNLVLKPGEVGNRAGFVHRYGTRNTPGAGYLDLPVMWWRKGKYWW